jgi:hypothetical protein
VGVSGSLEAIGVDSDEGAVNEVGVTNGSTLGRGASEVGKAAAAARGVPSVATGRPRVAGGAVDGAADRHAVPSAKLFSDRIRATVRPTLHAIPFVHLPIMAAPSLAISSSGGILPPSLFFVR